MSRKDSSRANLPPTFILKSTDKIGYPDASEDLGFLSECFVDSGRLSVLKDCSRPERIVLGRTGSGKSALLERLLEECEGDGRRFSPETLSLNYVTNSTILTALKEFGVNFDLFFHLLWKHVFAVELIKWRYGLTDEKTQRNFFQQVATQFKPKEKRALEYLQEFGSTFWIESDDRVVELTKNFERELKGSAGISGIFDGTPKLSGDVKTKMTETERHEIKERAQRVVSRVQARHLSEINDLLSSVLSDPQRKWYILVDRLDENWSTTNLKRNLYALFWRSLARFRPSRT